MAESPRKSNQKPRAIVAIIIMFFVAMVFFLLNYQKTTIIRQEIKAEKNQMLLCDRLEQNQKDVLKTTNPQNVKIEVRAIFADGFFDELAVSHYSVYDNESTAIMAESELHGAYNIYTGPNLNRFVPSYNIVENSVRMNLYATKDQSEYIKKYSNIFFLLENSETTKKIPDIDIGELKNNYTIQGFTCVVKE